MKEMDPKETEPQVGKIPEVIAEFINSIEAIDMLPNKPLYLSEAESIVDAKFGSGQGDALFG